MKLTGNLGLLAAGLFLLACGGGSGGDTTIHVGSADLSSLAVSEGTLAPAFSVGTLTYEVEVANSVTSVTVTAQAVDDGATILVNGSVPDGSGSAVIGPLAVGATAVGVVVTAKDGATKKTYQVSVTRLGADPSHNADLASLSLSAGTLQPAFSADVTAYAVKVGNAVSQIAFTAVVAGACATVEVRAGGAPTVPAGAAAPERAGGPVGCGAPSAPVPVAIPVGSSTIEVVVTAGDGTTKKTYAVTVSRASAGLVSADLSSLALSVGTLTPAFSAGTLTYQAEVANSVTSVAVTAHAVDDGATIRINGGTPDGSGSVVIPLAVGTSAVGVVVTANDGVTKKTYEVYVKRAAG